MAKRYIILLVAGLFLVVVGCEPEPVKPPETGVIFHKPAPDAVSPGRFRAIRVRLHNIELPAGNVSGSEDIWSYLNEEALGGQAITALGLNGMRVGLGRRDDWTFIERLLRKLTGRKLKEGISTMLPGQVSQIVIKANAPGKTLFVYQRDRTLIGNDFPAGDYILAISCTLDPDDPSKIVLSAVPQFRSTRSRTIRKIIDGRVDVVIESEETIFESTWFKLSMTSGDFIVIGPGVQSLRRTSLGGAILRHDKKGLPFETVLIISTEIFSGPIIPRAIDARR